MPEVIPSQIYLINTDLILMDYGLIIARLLEKCKPEHICINFCCWTCSKCWLWTRSASVHVLTRESKSMSIITSLVHGPAVFFLALATQISRHHSALRFLNFLPIKIRWGPVHGREQETVICVTDAATCVNCVNFCKLHALFADGITSSF